RLTTSVTRRSLPSDLLIFSLATVTHALCSQYRANGSPAARDCAISFSWCGKTRSIPPPWMSNSGPRYFVAIAEHSRCQPGRPGPQGVSHEGSPGRAAFHSAKSRGSCLAAEFSVSSDGCKSSGFWPDNAPYSGNDDTSNNTSPSLA